MGAASRPGLRLIPAIRGDVGHFWLTNPYDVPPPGVSTAHSSNHMGKEWARSARLQLILAIRWEIYKRVPLV